MITGEEVIGILELLEKQGIRVWVTGGWGIDALLGEETRPHKDLDILLLLDDIHRVRKLMGGLGYRFKYSWEENLWVKDVRGKRTSTGFVLGDEEGRELDIHALRMDGEGNGIPAWNNEEGLFFSREDLEGRGRIAAKTVKCISSEMQLRCHQGYNLPDYQLRDLDKLTKRI